MQFIGGEPTLYPGLPILIKHARKKDYEDVGVYINGTHMTATLEKVFLEHRVSLAFSLYGTSGAVHDTVTKRTGSFEKTSRALRWALESGLPARVGVIAMDSNAEDAARAERCCGTPESPCTWITFVVSAGASTSGRRSRRSRSFAADAATARCA